MKGMKVIAGIIAGAVAGYMVKRQMDRKTFQEQDDLICLYEDMIMGEVIDTDDVTRKYPPQAVWMCDYCDVLLFFHDSPERMQEHIREIRECDEIICPECNEPNEIDPVTRHILNQ